jgi:phosphate-selective porin
MNTVVSVAPKKNVLIAGLLALALLGGIAAPSFAAPTKGKRASVVAKKKSAKKQRTARRGTKRSGGSSFADQYRRYNDARRVWSAGPITGPMTWRKW